MNRSTGRVCSHGSGLCGFFAWTSWFLLGWFRVTLVRAGSGSALARAGWGSASVSAALVLLVLQTIGDLGEEWGIAVDVPVEQKGYTQLSIFWLFVCIWKQHQAFFLCYILVETSTSFHHLCFSMSPSSPRFFTCPQCLHSDFHSQSGLTQHQNLIHHECLPDSNAGDDKAMFSYLYYPHITGIIVLSIFVVPPSDYHLQDLHVTNKAMIYLHIHHLQVKSHLPTMEPNGTHSIPNMVLTSHGTILSS